MITIPSGTPTARAAGSFPVSGASAGARIRPLITPPNRTIQPVGRPNGLDRRAVISTRVNIRPNRSASPRRRGAVTIATLDPFRRRHCVPSSSFTPTAGCTAAGRGSPLNPATGGKKDGIYCPHRWAVLDTVDQLDGSQHFAGVVVTLPGVLNGPAETPGHRGEIEVIELSSLPARVDSEPTAEVGSSTPVL